MAALGGSHDPGIAHGCVSLGKKMSTVSLALGENGRLDRNWVMST